MIYFELAHTCTSGNTYVHVFQILIIDYSSVQVQSTTHLAEGM